MEESVNSATDTFARFYNQGLREGIMEAQENLTKLGYWEGLNSGNAVTKLLNKYTSALLVLESLNKRRLLWIEEKSSFRGQQIIETRKLLEDLLHKYESTLLELGSKYVEKAQQKSYLSEENPQVEEISSLEELKKSLFCELEYHKNDILRESLDGIHQLVNSVDEPVKSLLRRLFVKELGDSSGKFLQE
ncbi:hypothetical protein GpartN1_g7311.t1 [Galdieria partita]|uniref:Uncharacterized protein n=1 Tax=Galdieria partita TaxID=83374 RepID=A0A9C7UUH0_9RHOD|nr:hypothetical protein GpartN1_g7311.t1 [Galdieria partita]